MGVGRCRTLSPRFFATMCRSAPVLSRSAYKSMSTDGLSPSAECGLSPARMTAMMRNQRRTQAPRRAPDLKQATGGAEGLGRRPSSSPASSCSRTSGSRLRTQRCRTPGPHSRRQSWLPRAPRRGHRARARPRGGAGECAPRCLSV